MKRVKFALIILTACVVNVEQICSLKIDTMDTFEDRIYLKDPSSYFYSTGILKSHSGFKYEADRNKTLILSAPQGYSIFAALRLFDVRPNMQDSLKLFANGTNPIIYRNSYTFQHRMFDPNENRKTFYAPDGQLGVTFYTGSSYPDTWGYEGFELLYTVQANFTRCSFHDFHCSNGKCVSKSLKCDGHNHCGDRSDQRNCFVPIPVTPRSGKIIGAVSGFIFLLIAVACVIYITIRRTRKVRTETRTVINQHLPPTNLQGYPPQYSDSGMVFPPPPPPYSPYNQGVVNPGYQ